MKGSDEESTYDQASPERCDEALDMNVDVSEACLRSLAERCVEPGAVSSEPFPAPGSVLEGKYRLVSSLAFGSMGSVWRAEHLALDSPVAIKLMQPGADSDLDVRRRFLREARIATAVRSPHVVQVLDYGVERDVPYIVMEFLRGESLARRLRRVGRLSPAQTAAVIVPLGHALQRAHALGVVHRDIKPENVFIVQEGERELTKLLDFGVAKVRERKFGVSVSRDTAEGELVGTPHYMSPEQADFQITDKRSDLFSAGVVLANLILGHNIFKGPTAEESRQRILKQAIPDFSTLDSRVDERLNSILQRCLNRDISKRFNTADELMYELEYYIYHGGYGPTNETLGKFIRELFGQGPTANVTAEAHNQTEILENTARLRAKA